jgi:hypothetical protein
MWVCDPPDEDPQAAAKLEEAAARLEGLMVANVTVHETTFDAGKPVSVETTSRTVRMRDAY